MTQTQAAQLSPQLVFHFMLDNECYATTRGLRVELGVAR